MWAGGETSKERSKKRVIKEENGEGTKLVS